MVAPLYGIGVPIYLKESASLGFLEGYVISAVYNVNNQWIYVITSDKRDPSNPILGERISYRPESSRFFKENELIDELSAYGFIKESLTVRLADVDNRIATLTAAPGTGGDDTAGTS